MFNSARTACAALSGIALLALAQPAHAGQCPADQVKDNALTTGLTAPKDVTDNVIGKVDLGPEINEPGRSLRLRRLEIQPGGVVPWHSHKDRPAVILVQSGQIKEYRSNCATPITHKAGEVSQEFGGISHYWVNDGKSVAVLYSADVFHGE